MSIRQDLTINWAVSPRIIEITSDSSAITVQDLYDTLRVLSHESEAIAYPEIVDAGGKEGGVVAVTMTLFNAQLKFKDTGTPRLCKVSGGNLFAVDESNEDMSPIAYNDNITVGYAQSVAPAMVVTGSGVTEQDKVDIKNAVASELATVHGDSSWEGATPIQVWGHTDRRLSSRDIESEVPGEHLPSEEQVQALEPILNAIRQLVERGARGASFKA